MDVGKPWWGGRRMTNNKNEEGIASPGGFVKTGIKDALPIQSVWQLYAKDVGLHSITRVGKTDKFICLFCSIFLNLTEFSIRMENTLLQNLEVKRARKNNAIKMQPSRSCGAWAPTSLSCGAKRRWWWRRRAFAFVRAFVVVAAAAETVGRNVKERCSLLFLRSPPPHLILHTYSIG